MRQRPKFYGYYKQFFVMIPVDHVTMFQKFSHMFNDSEIAKSFSVGKIKCGYMINFGVAPYFKKMLLEKLKLTLFFVVCYDESMNRIFQEEQMDIVFAVFQ